MSAQGPGTSQRLLLPEGHFTQAEVLHSREPLDSVGPVTALKHRREDQQSGNRFLRVPASFDNVFSICVWRGRGQVAAEKCCCEPELAVPSVGVVELFHVQQRANGHAQPSLFLDLACGSLREFFGSLNAATRRDPKVVVPLLTMTDKEDLAIMFDERASG